jgi:transposase
VENANGLGRLLARRLLAADQQVVDVPASLASRVRMLSGAGHKTDAHDARSVAIACRHATRLRTVADDVDGVLLGLLVERRHQIVSQRQKTLCRIHEQLMSLAPGGCSHHLTVKRITGELARIRPTDPIGRELKGLESYKVVIRGGGGCSSSRRGSRDGSGVGLPSADR